MTRTVCFICKFSERGPQGLTLIITLRRLCVVHCSPLMSPPLQLVQEFCSLWNRTDGKDLWSRHHLFKAIFHHRNRWVSFRCDTKCSSTMPAHKMEPFCTASWLFSLICQSPPLSRIVFIFFYKLKLKVFE